MSTATSGQPGTDANPAAGLRSRFKEAAFWGVMGAIISRALNMAAWVICARLLGRSDFGQLTMVQSTAGVFGVLAGMGLGLTATRYIAEFRTSNPARAGRILGLSQLVAIVAGLSISAVMVALAPFLASTTLAEPALRLPLIVGSGLVLFGALNGFQTGALAGVEAFRTIAKVNFWAGLLSFPCIFLGAWLGRVPGAVAGLVLALAVNWLLNQAALRRECQRAGVPLTFSGCFAEWPILLHFSLPALLASAIVSPVMWLCNTWLVRQPGGFGELGLYGAADRWRLAILFVPASVASPVLSMLANLRGAGSDASYRKVFRTNLALTAGLVTALSITVALCAPLVMRLFGPAYRDGWKVLVVLSFSAVFEALNTFLGQPLVTHSMWRRFGFDAVLAFTLLTTAWYCIPRWRGLGLAVAYAAAFLTVSVLLAGYQRRRLLAP